MQVEFYDKGSQKIDEAKNEDRKNRIAKKWKCNLHTCTAAPEENGMT